MDNKPRSAPERSAQPPAHANQFALGRNVSPPSGWASRNLGALGTLATHPGLAVSDANRDDRRLILLGDLFDWQRPAESNQAILDRLADDHQTLDHLITATGELGGRWVMLWFCGDEAALFHDATGLRTVCYGTDSSGHLAAASDQGMLSRIAHLPADRAAQAFVEVFSHRVSQWWLPGDGLLFEDGRQLLPNHVLCLRTGTPRRYWPSGDPSGDPPGTLTERCAARLEGTVAAAARRYPLAIGLSAGWDSRLILAFCHGIRENIRVYSTAPASDRGSFADADLPPDLCATLGIRHERLEPQKHATPGFSRAFRKHVYRPLIEFEPAMEAELAFSQREAAGVTGNIAEVVKLPYEGKTREPGFDDQNPAHLARLVRMQGFDYAVGAIDRWRGSVPGHPRITVPELFYWENRCGRWLSRNALMFDMGWREIVMPFNCRALLADFLEIPPELRRRPKCRVFESMVRSRWPELLSVPVISKPPAPSGSKSLLSEARQSLRRLLRGRAGQGN